MRSAVAKARNRILRDGLEVSAKWTAEEGDLARCIDDLVRVRRERDIEMCRALTDPGEAEIERLTFIETLRGHARAGRIATTGA